MNELIEPLARKASIDRAVADEAEKPGCLHPEILCNQNSHHLFAGLSSAADDWPALNFPSSAATKSERTSWARYG
uniref:hypothetical protein n=1 Tax=Bradyrhizobium sp. (strain ORS 278) TaxID=114615 RepID=UPI0012FE8CE5|nr:hypothetical protein [Bradyrhizobium sp. ORS 278]